jgi:hypothetical protein
MNELIKELHDKARQFYLQDEYLDLPAKQLHTLIEEKFAELIVRECISINRQRMFSDSEGDSLRVAHNNALLCATSDMFEHFGVGE